MRHRSAGATLWKPSVLEKCMTTTGYPLLRESFTKIINIIAAGKAATELATDLIAQITAVNKNPGVRPLGIPSPFEGLTTRCLTVMHKKELQSAFLPHQFALNPRGTETVVHGIRIWTQMHQRNPRARILLIDFKNMFNQLKRKHFLKQLFDHFPTIATYAYWAYAHPKKAYWHGNLILSKEGLIQGCGVGPLCAVEAEDFMIKGLSEIISNDELAAILAAYLDDITVGCTETMATEVLLYIEREGPKAGCEINLTKTIIWAPCREIGLVPSPEDPRLPKGVVVVQSEGFNLEGTRLLGGYLGQKQFCESATLKRINTVVIPLLEKIRAVSKRNPQAAKLLLLNSGAVTCMNHIMRTTPTHLISDALAIYESLIRDVVSEIFGQNLDDQKWSFVALPLKMGGHAFRRPTLHAPAAHLSSLLSNRDQILLLYPDCKAELEKAIQDAVAFFNTVLLRNPGAVPPVTADSTTKFSQSQLSKKIDTSELDKLVKEASPDFKALILANQATHAWAWKQAPPNFKNKLNLLPDQFRISCQRSVRIPIFPDDLEACPICLQVGVCDKYGDHIVSCKTEGGVVHTHDDVRDKLLTWARKANLIVRKEEDVNLKRTEKDADPKWRADLILPNGIPGKVSGQVVLDIVVSNSLRKTLKKAAAKSSNIGSKAGENHKNNTIKDKLEANNTLIPVAFDVFSGAGSEMVPLTDYIITELHYALRIPLAEIGTLFWQTFSILIMRHKAEALLKALRLHNHMLIRNMNADSEHPI